MASCRKGVLDKKGPWSAQSVDNVENSALGAGDAAASHSKNFSKIVSILTNLIRFG